MRVTAKDLYKDLFWACAPAILTLAGGLRRIVYRNNKKEVRAMEEFVALIPLVTGPLQGWV